MPGRVPARHVRQDRPVGKVSLLAAIAVLALGPLGLALSHGAAQEQRFSVYLPWVENSGSVHISISLGPEAPPLYTVVPKKVTVRPGTPVVWDNRDVGDLIFTGVWNGSPLLSGMINSGTSFTAVFQSPGTLEWSVQSFSILRGLYGSGTVTVAE